MLSSVAQIRIYRGIQPETLLCCEVKARKYMFLQHNSSKRIHHGETTAQILTPRRALTLTRGPFSAPPVTNVFAGICENSRFSISIHQRSGLALNHVC